MTACLLYYIDSHEPLHKQELLNVALVDANLLTKSQNEGPHPFEYGRGWLQGRAQYRRGDGHLRERAATVVSTRAGAVQRRSVDGGTQSEPTTARYDPYVLACMCQQHGEHVHVRAPVEQVPVVADTRTWAVWICFY